MTLSCCAEASAVCKDRRGFSGVGSGGDFVLWLSYLSCSRNHGGIVYFWSERAQPLLKAVASSSGQQVQHGAAYASHSMVGSLDIMVVLRPV